MEQSLQHMTALLLEEMKASRNEMNENINAKAAARQEAVDAKAAASLTDILEDITDHIEAGINFVHLDLESTLKQRLEDVLPSVVHKTQSLHTEFREKIEKTQEKLQSVYVSLKQETKYFR
jgi:hypothetical protein